MNTLFRSLALLLIVALPVNSFALASRPSTGAQTFRHELNRFRSNVDQGVLPLQESVEEFARSVGNQKITVDDLGQYLKEELSPREYRAFVSRLEVSLKGIDPATLSAEELAELVHEAAAATTSNGLSWSSCPGLTVGGFAAVAAAGVLAALTVIYRDRAPDHDGTPMVFLGLGAGGAGVAGLVLLIEANDCY